MPDILKGFFIGIGLALVMGLFIQADLTESYDRMDQTITLHQEACRDHGGTTERFEIYATSVATCNDGSKIAINLKGE